MGNESYDEPANPGLRKLVRQQSPGSLLRPSEHESEPSAAKVPGAAIHGLTDAASALAHADHAGRERLLNRLQSMHGNALVQRVVAVHASATRAVAVQRDGDDERFRLTTPSLLGPSTPGPESRFRLRLDPDLELRMRAMQITQQLLDPAALRPALLRVAASGTAPQPNPLAGPSVPTPAPLVPRGDGPETPRAGEVGDIVSAVMAVPAIDTAITSLRDLALDRVRSDYRRLSTGDRIAAITASVLVGGAAVAGVASSPEGRRFALGQLNGRVLPVPGVGGLSVELNTERGGVMVGLHLDVGSLLPASLGFGPGSPSAIGGPPQSSP